MSTRRWLDVPFSEKEQAKAAGARWDPQWRRWYDPLPGTPALGRWDPEAVAARTFGEFRGPLAAHLNLGSVSMAQAMATFAQSMQTYPDEAPSLGIKFFPQPSDLPHWIESSGVAGGFAQIQATAVTAAMNAVSNHAQADLLWAQFETGTIDTNSVTTLIHIGRHARTLESGRWELLPRNFADTVISAATESYDTTIDIHCELIAAAKYAHRTCDGAEPGVTIRPIYASELWDDRY